ncbi:hypothetical protein BU25DRAFT_163886 [Macroventuria anomochaeta]|uniref:Uncharacterized protein n=1 Tax=Macroventuria anomochaeta TaxID=301207 RepID=A0ACB6RR99_9PLEO|nr:uncharacterized protein BU25DRAFT_163886 [Macroventuria anomochaeta]KAF2624227.1 hypothetical protein BU25DRAFT_163886 [Macroventuria anomochaeta]
MVFHKREPSKDITSNTAYVTPLPTYYSQQLPRWTSKSAFEDQKAFDVKTEPLDPCYPQFAMPRFDDTPLPPRPQRRRLPRKTILIPWILAAIFFLTTLWFTSIALGVRLFMVLQPAPTSPPVQEIRVMVDGNIFSTTASAYTSFVTLSASAVTATETVVNEFTTIAPVPRNVKTSPTGFITVAKMV